MSKQLSSIALGANLAEPAFTLNRAFEKIAVLPLSRVVACSSFYRSVAVGPVQDDYINAAALIETGLQPLALLESLQSIEDSLGRKRKVERWGPRLIDLDIITYGQSIVEMPELTIPHPEAYHRCFVLAPLAEIAPQLILPGYGMVSALLPLCDRGAARLLETERVLGGEGKNHSSVSQTLTTVKADSSGQNNG